MSNTKIPPAVTEISIAVPSAEYGPADNVSRHIDLQLDTVQARALKRAFVGLDESGSRLASGRRVASNADVIRFLLEQLAANR